MIAFDAATVGGFDTASYSHTVGAGSDRILIVTTIVEVVANGGAAITGVTYGGVAMTSLGAATFSYNNYAIQTWYLFAPTAGAANVVLGGAFSTYASCAVSYSGVLQTSIPDALQVHSGNNSPYSESLTTVAIGAWQFFITRNDVGTASASTGSTRRAATALAMDFFDSNGIVPPGSNSMTVTVGGVPTWASVMFSLAPAKVTSMLALF